MFAGAAELTLADGYRYFTAAAPTPLVRGKWYKNECEVHVRMFSDRPECDYAIFYDAAVTRKSLEAVLEAAPAP